MTVLIRCIIVNPIKVHTKHDSEVFYEKLLTRFRELKTEMVCGNFLMPFRGTKLWDEYKDLITEEDFKYYDSKSAFIEKDKTRRLEEEYDMFYYQYLYYHSDFYQKNIRTFDIGDTLSLKFKELERKFNGHVSA